MHWFRRKKKVHEASISCGYCGNPTEKGKRVTDAETGLIFCDESCYFKAFKEAMKNRR